MWLAMLGLVAPALADSVPYAVLARTPPAELAVVERFADLFDDDLRRRLQRRSGLGAPTPDENLDLVGSAVGSAAVDWSVWVLRQVPTPTLQLSVPKVRWPARGRTSDMDYAPSTVVVETDRPSPGSVTGRSKREVAPTLDLALTPRLPAGGTDERVDAVVQASASGLGPSAWRLSSRPMAKSWSVWMRQALTPGISVVAAADSEAKEPRPAGFSGGALVRVPGESWRVFARYGQELPRIDRAREHEVGFSVSVAPVRKR